jgi:hypothetical protein
MAFLPSHLLNYILAGILRNSLHALTVHTFSGSSSPALQETRTNSRPAPGQSSPSLIAPEAGYQAAKLRGVPRQQTLGSAGF